MTKIGVIVPEIKHDFFSSAISGIEEVAYHSGYTIIVCQSNENFEREVVNTNALIQQRVAGIVASISQNTKNGVHFQGVIDHGIPLVFFDHAFKNISASKVIIDDAKSAFEAVSYLIDRGYKKIAHFAGPKALEICKKRLSGYLVMPSFEKKVLIIDETDEFNFPFVTNNISDATVDNFYSNVFSGADTWDYKANKGMPSRAALSKYKLVVWHADDWPQSNPHKISDPKNIEIFTDYLKVGGKFLMSGWGILKSFAYNSNFPYTFPPGSFVYDYLHIRTVAVTELIGDFIGGESAMASFSSFKVDSSKTAFFPFFGKLGQVNLIISPAGFTVSLYTYNNLPSSSYVKYRGRTIALRYYGTVFDAVILGFPLYFINEKDAIVMGKQILRNLNIE